MVFKINSFLDSLTLQGLEAASVTVQNLLINLANNDNFISLIKQAFGDNLDEGKAEQLRQEWANGDFTSFPEIEIRGSEEINGALGAFSSDTNRIYLSQGLITDNQSHSDAFTQVLLEEIGHFVDSRINVTDTPGDEGAIFSALVQRQVLSQEQLQQLKAEDDTATVIIDGQTVQIEQAKPVSESGGVGGNKIKVFTLDPLPQGQTEKNVTLTYSYEHFSIPDQFEVRYGGNPIFSTQRLVSGGKSGSITFKQLKDKDKLDILVTAPQSGTAWQFSVSTENAQINVNGLLGDVTKIDLGKQKGNLTLKSLPDASKGKLIDSKGENATTGKQYDTLFFVPKVTGAIQEYGKDRQSDPGLGQVTFDVEDQAQKSLTVKVSVTDGFSTAGDNKVTTGTDKIDIYRQQQRLAYLGFPGSNGNPLVVDGQSGGNTTWAKTVFDIAVNPNTSGRGRVTDQNHGDKNFKASINSSQAPKWNSLKSIQGLNFSGTERRYGMDLSGRFIENAFTTFGSQLTSTGVTKINGNGDPSKTHDAGRSIDIDEIPGSYFFKVRNGFVASPGGKIVVKDGNSYRAGDPKIKADTDNGLTYTQLSRLKDADAKSTLKSISNLIEYSQTKEDVQSLIDAFSGATIIFYNDPRFFGTGIIQFSKPHYDHIHFGIPSPISNSPTKKANLIQLNNLSSADNVQLFAAATFASTNSVLDSAVDLGNINGTTLVNGSLSSSDTERYYRFTVGDSSNSGDSDEEYFVTTRNLSLLLDNLSADADIEVFQDFNGDGVRQDDDVLFASTESATSPDSISLTDIPEGNYFIRVFSKVSGGSNIDYRLSVTVPPLPVPTDNAGNTVTNAKNFGIISNNVQQSDFIGQVDTDDYYTFTLSSTSDLSVDVNDLSNGDLFAELGQDKNNDGILDFDEIIAVSDEEGDASEKINYTGLAAGNYVLHLGRGSGNTDYNLNLSATPSIIPIDKAGDTPATAFNLGSLTTSTQSDFIGNVDPTDYYRFSLTNPSGVTLNLTGLLADVDLELSQDKNGDGLISSSEVIQLSEAVDNQDENIEITALAPGDYFVKVSQYDGDTNYNLSLTPTTATGVDLQVTVTPITTPLILGDRVNYTVTVKNVGASSATGVILRDNLPLESVLSLSAASSKGFANIFTNEIRANIGTLNVNEAATLVVSGEIIGSGLFSSLIQASSTNTDYNPDNNSVVQRFNVGSGTIQPADLELSLTSNQATANINDLVTLRLTLTNKGPGAATSIRVKNLLAQGLTFVSSSPQQGSYNPVSGIWDAGNIAKDNQAFVNIVAKVTSVGNLSNTAEIIAVNEPDPDSVPNNNNPNEDDQASVTIVFTNQARVLTLSIFR
ncbi:MAG: pre-peptidase C-terminal domain-containing protein [Gloeotrichia echinulata GP01]